MTVSSLYHNMSWRDGVKKRFITWFSDLTQPPVSHFPILRKLFSAYSAVHCSNSFKTTHTKIKQKL